MADEEQEHAETWEEMTARIAYEVSEEQKMGYAANLARSMNCFLRAGFSHQQAWDLTLAEHQSRLEYMTQRLLHNLYSQPDEDEG